MANPVSWGSDEPISMPETRQAGDAVDLGSGHVFTRWGLAHNFGETDAEVFYQPVYAPLPSPEAAG